MQYSKVSSQAESCYHVHHRGEGGLVRQPERILGQSVPFVMHVHALRQVLQDKNRSILELRIEESSRSPARYLLALSFDWKCVVPREEMLGRDRLDPIGHKSILYLSVQK